MIRPAVASLAFLALTGTAFAYPNCITSGGPTIRIEIGIGDRSEADQEKFDIMNARRHGIIAYSATRTHLECIKILRIENGRWLTEYYDPKNWQRVY